MMLCPSVPQFTPEQLGLAEAIPIGSGAISHVVRTTLRARPRADAAIKIVSKIQLLQHNKVCCSMNEKTALAALGPHPFIGRLFGTSQSEDELYFVMEWLPHGDLLQHIRRATADQRRAYALSHATGGEELDEQRAAATPIPSTSDHLRCLSFDDARLILAQLILGLAQVFARGFVLRDLKPENVAFDAKFRACIIDFDTVDVSGAHAPETNHGIALPPTPSSSSSSATSTQKMGGDVPPRRRLTVSEIQSMRKRTASFCGTAQYVSPEMVGECKWSYSSDLWALGALAYELIYGQHMFSGSTQMEVMRKVIAGAQGVGGDLLIDFPSINLGCSSSSSPSSSSSSSSSDAASRFARMKDFIMGLVRIDPHERLGVDATTHAFHLDALKNHALFDGFDWRMLEEQVEMFQPIQFATQDPNQQQQHHDDDDDGDDADPSPSLKAHYHRVPFNDPSYANYIYHETADTNPFERFLREKVLGEEVAAPSNGGNNNATDNHAPTEEQEEMEAEAAVADDGDDDDDDDVEIVDDVGMCDIGFTHPDFHS